MVARRWLRGLRVVTALLGTALLGTALLGITACSGGKGIEPIGTGGQLPGSTTLGGTTPGGAPTFPMDSREALVSVLGTPDAMSGKILVVGDLEMWVESYTYADLATRFDLSNGLVVGSEAIDPFPDGTLLPLHVGVRLGMTEAEVRDTLIGFELTEVDGATFDLPAGSSILAGGQVMIGLFEDRVVYLQTYPLVPDADGEFQAYLDGDQP